MNKNSKRTYWARQEANKGAERKSKKPKVAARPGQRPLTISEQLKMLGYIKKDDSKDTIQNLKVTEVIKPK